jgi:hypothetical protein
MLEESLGKHIIRNGLNCFKTLSMAGFNIIFNKPAESASRATQISYLGRLLETWTGENKPGSSDF